MRTKHRVLLSPASLFIAFMAAFCAVSLILTAEAQPGRSTVVSDNVNKQNLAGQTRIALAWGQQFEVPQNLVRGVINLREAMNRWTNIETGMDRHLMLSDQRMLSVPFVFVTTDEAFELTETEKKNVRAFFENGGFMFLDNPNPVSEVSAKPLKKLLSDTIPNARFEPIPVSHDIYHCFFDFDDGPPLGAELGKLTNVENSQLRSREQLYLEGVTYKGRLVAVYSNKGYVVKWAEGMNNDPQLRMGVNLIVYAMTH